MAKVTRKKLARGVELTVDQVYGPIDAMGSELSRSAVETDQMATPSSVFRLNFNIPWMDSKYFYDNRTSGTTVAIKVGGTGYATVVHTTTGGAGSGLTVTVLEVDAFVVIAVEVLDPGTGYANGDVVTVFNSGSNDCELTVTVGDDAYDGPLYIPFCLPPLQDEIVGPTVSPTMKDDTPFPILEEVSFSLDQSDEPAAILGQWYGKEGYKYGDAEIWIPNPHAGKKTYNRPDAYDFTLSIYEKEQEFFNVGLQTDADGSVGAEAVSITIPSSAFMGRTERFNPIEVGGINREFHPLKTYCLAIFAPKLHDQSTAREHCVALNVWVSLKFKRLLTKRDVTDADSPEAIQNVPLHYGAQTGMPITTNNPLPETVVTADNAQGVSTNLQIIDQVFSDKIRGGYGTFAQAYPSQAIQDDSGYEVIAVPVGGGFPHNRMSALNEFPLAPYVSGSAFTTASPAYAENPYVDRRLIPIEGDMTVHHVIAALNWTSDKIPLPQNFADSGQPTYRPSTFPSGKTKFSIGVGMLCGPRADNFDYQQVAYSEFTPTTYTSPPDGLIDGVLLGLPASAPLAGFREWQLISVPIVAQVAIPGPAAGRGYWGFQTTGPTWARGEQGAPYFVGPGNTYTSDRTPVGTGTGVAPLTANSFGGGNNEGTEQFLEVRLKMEPINGAVFTPTGAPGSGTLTRADTAGVYHYGASDIFLGYGGCWVYIIGKKHLK